MKGALGHEAACVAQQSPEKTFDERPIADALTDTELVAICRLIVSN
jgi:hypothetical protein